MENSEKDLDLIDFIKLCWRWTKRYIISPLFFLISFMLKKWWVGAIGIATGVLISVLIWLIYPIYQGNMIIANNVSDSSDFINNLKTFNLADPQYKSNVTGIPLEEIKKINRIKPHFLCYTDSLKTDYVVDYQDSASFNKTIPLSNKFCIEVEAKETSVYSYLNDGFLKYINDNSYYQRLNNQRLTEMRENVKMAETESVRLDSIMDKRGDDVMFSISGTGNMMSSMVKPAELVNEKLRLGGIIISSNNILNYQNEIVYIVSGMQVNEKPKNFITKTVKTTTIASFLIIYFIALIITYWRSITPFISKKE